MVTVSQGIRERLHSGQPVLGSVVFEFGVSALPALTRESGADFLLVDMEHTSFDLATVRRVVEGCHYESVAAIVRVPSAADDALIGKLLEFGAAGVMGPMVDSRADAQRLVAATRYPPDGVRGVGYGPSTAWRGDEAQRREWPPLVVAQIESAAGLSHVDEIAAADGVDVLWIGQRDLSLALGVPGQFASGCFVSAIRRVAEAAIGAGKSAGYLVDGAELATTLAGYGYRCFAVGSDVALYRCALEARVEQVRQLFARDGRSGVPAGS